MFVESLQGKSAVGADAGITVQRYVNAKTGEVINSTVQSQVESPNRSKLWKSYGLVIMVMKNRPFGKNS